MALALDFGLRLLRQQIFGVLGARFETRENIRAVSHMMDSDLRGFQAHSSGTHMEFLGSISTLREFASGQIMISLYDVPFIAIYLGLIIYIGGPLAAIPVVGMLFLCVTALPELRHAHTALTRITQVEDRRLSFIISLLTGIQSVKAMALEQPLLRRYERLQEDRLTEHKQAELSGQHLAELGQFTVQIAGLLTVGFGSLMVLDGALSVGGLSACMLLVGRALAPMQSIMQFWSRLQSASIARRQLSQIYEMPLAARGAGTQDATATEPQLALEGIHFGFENGNDLLDGIDLDVRRSEIVALVGANGSGKSTLLSIVAGFYTPSQGRLLLDGRELTDYEPESLRHAIALLPQHEILFRGTITENITMFRPELEEAAMMAAERVGLLDLIHALPHGFSTYVGDGATEPLPRGLAQRIAVARALMNRPRIILFDDANSAVDDDGDRSLFALLNEVRSESLVILVSHRPAVLKLADRIYSLSDGKLDLTQEFQA
ncbi:peptidase domain-containing ABC transporter [Niveispirillum sp. KHB5.9]|uniref:peptidase domain-containing ABC transporter n=1 Tax=Niveispirillum sp. KHB5.9 TaxID=3400269 RepID=UPI003A873BEA